MSFFGLKMNLNAVGGRARVGGEKSTCEVWRGAWCVVRCGVWWYGGGVWWSAVGPVGYHGALLGGVSRSKVSRGVGKM